MKICGKIPLTMSPGFWVVAALIGYLNTNQIMGTLIWMGVIFVSVLIHELGHACMAYRFGLSPRIELIAFGGLTHHFGKGLSTFKQFLIVLAGPLFGILLFFTSFLINKHCPPQNLFFSEFFLLLQAVNLFWTIVNMLPVLPLDGGQMLRLILEAIFGPKGFGYAVFCSMLIAVLGCLFFFFYQQLLIGAFFFLFAYQSFTDWRKIKNSLSEDVSGDLRKKFSQAESDLHAGQKEKALEGFQEILKNPSKGLICNLSAQYLAFLEYDKGRVLEAYNILLPERKKLTNEGLYLLHKVAFEVKDYPLVVELSGPCFQSFPGAEVSLKAAKSHAMLGQLEPCIGWLETSLEQGLILTSEMLAESFFDPIRERSSFVQWVKTRLS